MKWKRGVSNACEVLYATSVSLLFLGTGWGIGFYFAALPGIPAHSIRDSWWVVCISGIGLIGILTLIMGLMKLLIPVLFWIVHFGLGVCLSLASPRGVVYVWVVASELKGFSAGSDQKDDVFSSTSWPCLLL